MLEEVGKRVALSFMSYARIHNIPRTELDSKALEFFIEAAARESDLKLVNTMQVLCEIVALNGYEYVERVSAHRVMDRKPQAKHLVISKEAQRAMLEKMCADFPKENVQYIPRGVSAAVSGKGWRNILQTPGKTDLEKVKAQRELDHLLRVKAALDRELKEALKRS